MRMIRLITLALLILFSGLVTQLSTADQEVIYLSSSVNPSYYEQPVTFHIQLSDNNPWPTGTFTFYDNGVQIGAVDVSQTPWEITVTGGSGLDYGPNNINADYSGDSNYDPSQSSTL